MKELEEVGCEIRRVIDLQVSVSDRFKRLEGDENGPYTISHGYNGANCPRGGFLSNATYAWLSCESHLVVFNVKTGENVSSWTFRERITCVSQFPTQPGDLPLLLVGLDNGANRLKDSIGMLCIFNCTTSRVLRAIRMPVGVEQVCIVSGGAEWEEFNDKRPDNILVEMEGIACVILRNLYHIMIDLQRSTWETPNSSTMMDEAFPAEIEFLSARDKTPNGHRFSNDKHAAYNLLNSRIEKHIGFNREEFELSTFFEDALTSAVISSTKIGCLISGCLGRVIIWQNDGSVGWISIPVDENMTATHLALLEPTDDPRPFYYLWVVFQDDSWKVPPVLRMYALLFERKYCDRGTNLYFNLEAEPSLKFEFELDEGDKVVSLSTIERECNPDQTDTGIKRGEDNLLLISTKDKMLLFDLNQWYKEQMPQTINECQNPNSILASYRTKFQACDTADSRSISCTYIPNTLREFPSNCPTSLEELYYPNSLSLEWVELSLTKLVFGMSRGIQAELLRAMAIAGPIVLTQPSETFHKCLSVGLVPFNSEFSFTSDQNEQRDMLLSLCLEQRWAMFLVRCAKEWLDGSAACLYPSFLKWGVQRAASIKIVADQLCVPLFDQSGSNIGETEVKTLRFCSQQLECLSNVVAKLPFETTDLMKQRRALKHISTHLQVLLWFYDVGLLPETQDLEEGPLPIPLTLKIPYPYEKLSAFYKEKRELLRSDKVEYKTQWEEELFIDEFIARECPILKSQWERESGDCDNDGSYPPPSLQSLLRSYFTDCQHADEDEIECKHQITIYLLMDLAMLLQGSYPGVDQLIKYPSAFKMSPSVIKLTQAFWLLDHEDYQGFLDMMTGQLVSDSDVKDWHHQLVLRTLVRNNQHKLALIYLRIRKPPLYSIQDQSTLISLSVEHGLVQSAFHRRPPFHYAQLLNCFFQACRTYGKLNDVLHLALDSEEEEAFVKFLEEGNSEDMRLLYYLQRCRYTEANNGTSLSQVKNNFPKHQNTPSFTMLNAYNTTLPDVIKRFTVNTGKTNLDMNIESRYPRPMSHYKGCSKGMGLYETVIRKAKETYLRGEKCQIPFVSAPCMSLKGSDSQANMNCVLFPTLLHKNRGKRTFDQIHEDGENRVGTPDGAKRRKLYDAEDSKNKIDKKDLTLGAAFDTPLVKRKSNVINNRDSTSETPHSILKIRQLIRHSTSPSIPTLQTDIMDGPCDSEKKISRQIRFNISNSKNSTVQDEINDEEDVDKYNVSRESDDVFFSPDASTKSHSESTRLLDSSHSSKHVSGPRPRPSLRRSSLQSSKEYLYEIPSKSVKTSRSMNLSKKAIPVEMNDNENLNVSVASDNMQIQSNMNSPEIPRPRNSILCASAYSTSVLSTDSSFEITTPLRKLQNTNARESSKLFAEHSINYSHMALRTSFTKTTIREELEDNKEQIDIDESIHMDVESSFMDTQRSPQRHHTSTSIHEENDMNSTSKLKQYKDNKHVAQDVSLTHSNYTNGNITKNNILHVQTVCDKPPDALENNTNVSKGSTIDDASDEESMCLNVDEDGDNNEEAFESLTNIADNSTINPYLEHVPSVSSEMWDYHSKPGNGIQETAKLDNDKNFDITDDESSGGEGEMILPQQNVKLDTKYDNSSVPVNVVEIYDTSNITEDESDSSTDMVNLKQMDKTHSTPIQMQDNDSEIASRHHRKRTFDSTVDNDPSKSKMDNIKLQEARTSVSKKDIICEDTIEPKETPVRITRSRRASSVMKDMSTSFSVDSPTKSTPAEKNKRSRRASSLAKEVLTTPVISMEESIKLIVASGSEESFGTGKSRTRRSSSVAKDIEKGNGGSEDTVVKVTTRRSTRRAASVQKDDISESEKSLVKTNRRLSLSNIISEDYDKQESGKKNVRNKTSSVSTRKSSTTSQKTNKITEPKVDKVEETVIGLKRTRGSSVPKETVSEIVRTRRSRSVAKDIIPEISEFRADEKTLPSTTVQRFIDVVESPAKNTRSRRSSIQSIPEELEEILSISAKDRSILEKETRKNPSRQRRAASVDLPQPEIKRRTRSLRIQSIAEEAILEESSELEHTDENPVNTKKVPTRRKRTTSSANLKDAGEEKSLARSRRGRKSSVKEDSVTQFCFSQPENANDIPLDGKALAQVPNYEFSPPQTKSKQTSANLKDAGEDKSLARSRRGRKSSVKEDSVTQFCFSQPENANDIPLDGKALAQVPYYVFSPPQTRSKNIIFEPHRE
ncbi:hypothetical protein KM043_012453 [Ampulex compressa]|nr:hypothetical protein KM043_012453 [Ampulex compressa]